MCGISLVLSQQLPIKNNHSSNLKHLISRRGPDFNSEISNSNLNTFAFSLFSSVLHLRGEQITQQPIENNEKILAWNGEIYLIYDSSESTSLIPNQINDGFLLFNALSQANTPQKILKTIRDIEGPFSFIYIEKDKNRLWFSRDYFGRRSLLWSLPTNDDPTLHIASVADLTLSKSWEEVPAKGIYHIDLNKGPILSKSDILCFDWGNPKDMDFAIDIFTPMNKNIPDSDIEIAPWELENLDKVRLEVVDEFIYLLGESVKLRVNSLSDRFDLSEPSIAILFSGGVDCLCLAVLLDRYLHPKKQIDLINVAFENPRINASLDAKNLGNSNSNNTYNVPDRKTGLEALKELRHLSPNRNWNFVYVDVPFTKACKYKDHIMNLSYPQDTVMDLSIAMALWFAARGKGYTILKDGTEKIDYTTPARVVFLGMGADEQLGGYSRYRTKWEENGWEGVVNELEMEVNRISARNLGRDDRIISDHGRESRLPFLGRELVNFLSKLPAYLKLDLRLPRGQGEKWLIRMAAKRLGCKQGAERAKRAIQFGARTAKMETSKERGWNRV